MKFSVDKIREALKKLTTKRIALIIMCVMLAAMVIMAAVVMVKVSPVLSALLGSPDETNPTQSSTETTVPPTTTEPEDTKPTETVPPTQPSETYPQHEHEYTILTEEEKATCTTAGYSVYSCECGKTKILDYTDPKGHTYGPGKLVTPTCTEEGYTELKCTVCGSVDRQDEKEALGHDYVLVEERRVSCEEDGYTEYTCSREGCGDTKHENVVKAAGHQYEEAGVKAPTCTEDGHTLYVCAVCKGETKDDVVKSQGHKFGAWEVAKDPKTGYPGEETRKCSVCSEEETRECELDVIDERKTEDADSWHYIIKVGAKDTKNKEVAVYIYEVVDCGRFSGMDFTYDSESGLIVNFIDKDGKKQTYALAAGNYMLVIDENGKQGTHDNSNFASEPTSEPTGESAGE